MRICDWGMSCSRGGNSRTRRTNYSWRSPGQAIGSFVYFASLYLGAAQERLSQVEQARGSYRHAAELYPKAQSPRLALSALAWRRGEGETARSEMQSVTERPGAAGISRLDDPWWDYNTLPERNVDTLFDALRPAVSSRPGAMSVSARSD